MKISQVEALVGVTRKNIRFYEKEGLLAPGRDSGNGYREYDERDVAELKKIKLLRMLGLPLAEIRQMQTGASTVGDAVRRHLITLERQRVNLEQMTQLCESLKDCPQRLEELDGDAVLQRMEQLERGGVAFRDIRRVDVRRQYLPAVAAAAVIAALMLGVAGLLLWAYLHVPEGRPPLPVLALLAAAPCVVILGVVLALTQRIGEIRKGEIEDAKRY